MIEIREATKPEIKENTMIHEYHIYQVPVGCSYCFMSFDFAMKHNWKSEDYVHVYHGYIESETVDGALEELWRIFNIDHPSDYYGRSLSMSDMVIIDKKRYYCDSFGWKECPEDSKEHPIYSERFREIAETAISYLADNDELDDYLEDRGIDLSAREKEYFLGQ